MLCPYCKSESKVLDSRISTDGFSIRRRRECLKCAFRFSTVEEVRILDFTVIKRDGSPEPYFREKIERGLRRALEKRKYSDDRFRRLIIRIERDIQARRSDKISSKQIGAIIMKHLKRFDKVAYIRFASVYRQFENVGDFIKQIKAI